MNSRITVPVLALVFLFTGCGEQGNQPAGDAETTRPAASETPAKVDLPALREQVAGDLHKHTAVLASDEFGGRAPGTPGEEKTIEYLRLQFAELGLEPGNGESWYQQVPVTAVDTDPSAVMKIRGTGYGRDLAYGEDVMVFTQRQLESVRVEDSPVVFVGYGISAPERSWNDYADIDVSGKTVMILINDPGFATQDDALFNGNTMTYYGRWDYKFEEAARQGAAAAIIVHETAPAAYPWEVVTGSWSGPQIGLTDTNHHRDKLKVESWMTVDAARELFAAAGARYDELKALAARPGFRPVKLGDFRMSVSLDNTLASTMSNNVVARLPGTRYPDEHIVYTAHWDHLGTKPEAEGEDKIYNGASDNATGTAGLLALARLHAVEQSPRSILFLAVTAEESGLLGARWYTDHPIYPLDKTVANLNMDNIYGGVDGRNRDVAVVGFGNSELESYLAVQATTQRRVLVQEPNPERGYYYRSDHFNFAREGVPALYLTRGVESLENGKTWGQEQLDAYIANDYHKPSDEYSADWDLNGAAEDVLLLYGVARQLANGRDWPKWKPWTEFKSKRDESSASRD